MKHRTSTRSGFTLLEFLISFAVLVLIAGSIIAFQGDFLFTNRFLSDFFSAEASATGAVDTMVREMRSASPSAIGGYPIEQASGSQFTFFSDTDNDGISERISYFLSKGQLRKSVVHPGGNPLTYSTSTVPEELSVVVRSVISTQAMPLFAYYTGQYTGTGTSTLLAEPINVNAIRHMQVKIAISVAAAGVGTTTASFSGDITIRTLKFRGSLGH